MIAYSELRFLPERVSFMAGQAGGVQAAIGRTQHVQLVLSGSCLGCSFVICHVHAGHAGHAGHAEHAGHAG